MAVVSRVSAPAVPRGRLSLLTRQDKVLLALMLGVPTLVHLFLVWVPAVSSIALSFTRWNGVGGFATIEPIGLKNYSDIVSIYPPFWPALVHNVIWLGVLLFLATPFGMFLAVLLDHEVRGLRFYQSVFFLPVVLVITIIEALRAFDLVYVVNKGRNGLELISVLVTNNIIGEASRVGFGSALAVILLVISLGAIVPYLWRTFHADAEAA